MSDKLIIIQCIVTLTSSIKHTKKVRNDLLILGRELDPLVQDKLHEHLEILDSIIADLELQLKQIGDDTIEL